MMTASIWSVYHALFYKHVLCELYLNTIQISTSVHLMEDWVHVIRYVPILQDHFTAAVKLGMLYRDMPAMVRNAV